MRRRHYRGASRKRPRRWATGAVVLLTVANLGALGAVRNAVLSIEETPAARGEHLARDLGCFGCHGPGGNGGIPNPKTRDAGDAVAGDQEVPAFTQQTQMMYVKTTDDLREYILDGAPRRRRLDPGYQTEVAAFALRMPAYRSHVSARQVDDLVAFLRSASGQILPEEKRAARGGELALTLGCFSCHGQLGGGGVSNPGSLKGYIPAFWGGDFDDLVHDDDELRQWIADGKIARIAAHPIGRIFFERQALKMPAYGRVLPPADVEALIAYVRWLRDGRWRAQLD